MSSAGVALRRAVYELVGADVQLEVAPGYRGLLQLYGSNAAIADAAGYRTGSETVQAYRVSHPRAIAPTIKRVRDKARRERASFLRNLQRYRQGSTPGPRIAPLLERVRTREIERRHVSSLFDLMAIVAREGWTVRGGVTFRSGYDDRERDIHVAVAWVPSSYLRDSIVRRDWDSAGEQFFYEYGQAYGVPGGFSAEDVGDLEIEVGMAANAYRFPVSA